MTEYLFGRDGQPIGAELDALTDAQRESLSACAELLVSNADRVKHFTARVRELGRSGADTVITLINVDDPSGNGALLADMLMPGHDWQQYRDRGETPIARGLAAKESFPGILNKLGYHVAANELASNDDLRIIVLHGGTVQIMDAQFEQ